MSKYYAEILRRKEQDKRKRLALVQPGVPPEQHAEALNLAKERELPVDLVSRNLKEVRDSTYDVDTDEPTVKTLLDAPDIAPAVKDDISSLSWFEKQKRGMSQGLQQGSSNVELSQIGMEQMFGNVTEDQLLRGDYLDKQSSQMQDYDFNYFEGVPSAVAENLPIWGQMMWGAKEEAAAGAGAGFLIGAAGGSVVPVAGTMAGATAGAASGFGYGFRTGTAIEAFNLEAGLAYREYMSMEGTLPMDSDTARGAAVAVGVVNAGLESMGLNLLLKRIPGADKVFNAMSREGVKKLMKIPTARQAMQRFGKTVATGMMTEGATEGLQELVTTIGGVLAGRVAEGEFDAPLIGEVGARVWESAVKGSQGGGGFAAGGATIQAGIDTAKIRRANQRATAFKELGEQAQGSKTRERLPDVFKKFIKDVNEKYGEVNEVFVDAEVLKQYFQMTKVPDDMPETIRSMEESDVTGAPVAIPMDEFIAYIAPSDNFNELSPDLKFMPDELSQREAEQLQAETDAMYNEMSNREDKAEAGSNPVYDDMKTQLEAAGRSPTVAEHEAKVWSTWFNVQSKRTGQDAFEMYKSFNASVSHSDLRAQPRKGVSGLENMLDMLRTGQRPSQKDIFGDSFGEFLAKKGGIRDYGGELKARDLDRRVQGEKGLLFGGRSLSQEDGMAIDDVIAVGIEEGYFPESAWDEKDNNFVLELLDDEVQGNPLYRDVADENALSLTNDLDNLEYELERRGIDMDEVSNEDIVRFLDETTLYQSNYSDLTAADKKIVNQALKDVDNPKRTRKLLDEFAGTPWARQAIQGAKARAALKQLIDGKDPEFDNAFNAPGAANLKAEILAGGEEVIWSYLEKQSIIGHPSKPVNSVNSSFINCEPSPDCAVYCYAAKGRAAMTNNIRKAEMVAWAIENDPVRAAKITSAQYGGMAESMAGKALRLFDKGEGNSKWIPYIKELNRLGVRTHIFSKVPEFLRQVPDGNLKMLSIDKTNLKLAENNPDLDVAFVYSGSPADRVWLNEHKDQVQMILPVVLGQQFVPEVENKAIGKWARSRLCPVDRGAVTIKDGWNCTRCDKGGGVGCYHGQTSEQKRLASIPLVDILAEPGEQTIYDELKELENELTETDRQELHSQLAELLSEVRSGFDQESEAGTTGAIKKSPRVRKLKQLADDGRAELRTLYQGEQGDLFGEPAPDNEGRAKAGGQTADSNGFFYKGGQFLPSTEAPPGSWRVNINGKNKNVKPKGRLIEPGVFEEQPEYGAVPIFEPISAWTHWVLPDGTEYKGGFGEHAEEGFDTSTLKLALNKNWTPETHSNEVAEGVSLFEQTQTEVDAYNAGQRWKIPDNVDGVVIDDKTKRRNQEERGYIQFDELKSWFNITLTENADMSTFLHESGHFFLEGLHRLATVEGAPDSIVQDMEIIKEWLGVDGEFTVEQHEKWARGFEAYLMEGNAPSLGLAAAFERFRSWMKSIYKTFTKLDVELSDEVRGVMDRMLATDEQIAEAKKEIAFMPLFENVESSGMTAEEYAAYNRLHEQRTRNAEDDLEKDLMSEVSREARKQLKDAKEAATARITEEVNARPEYAAARHIRNEQPLSTQALKAMYGGAAPKRLAPGSHKLEGGVHPDDVAGQFGFKSGDEMIQAILTAPKPSELIAKLVDQEVQPKNSLANGEVHEKAIKALHNDPTALFIHAELKALGKRIGQETTIGVVKRAAQRQVGAMRLMDMKPAKYRAAEKRASLAAAKALREKNIPAAHDAKRKQLMNHYMYMEITRAKAESADIYNYLKRFDNDGKLRERLGKTEYLEAIDTLLEGVELKKSVTLKRIGRRKSLQEFVDSKYEEDEAVFIPEQLLNEAELTSYKEMTMEEFRTLQDSIKNIDHLSRLKNKLQVGKAKRDFRETMDQIVGKVYENNDKKEVSEYQNPTKLEKAKSWVAKAHAQLSKVEFIVKWIDNEVGGFAHQVIFQPFVDAQARKYDMLNEMNDKLKEIFSGRSKDQIVRHNATYGFMDKQLKGEEIIAVALNVGNQGNLVKLVDGYGWNASQMKAELDNWMGEEDWKMVQDLWDTIDTLYPHLDELNKRTTGLPLKKVDATPVTTRFGVYRGGYYPVMYDPSKVTSKSMDQAKHQEAKAAKGLFENNFMRPDVDRGLIQTRTAYTAPMLLSLDVIPAHVNEAIHYITHYEAVVNAYKVTQDKEFRIAIAETMGQEIEKQFLPWLQSIANDSNVQPDQSYIDSIMKNLRGGMTVVAMGFKLSTATMQLFGLFTTIDEIGMKATMSGMKQMLTHPREHWDFINESSGEMRHILTTFDRDVKRTIDQMFGKTNAWDFPKQYAFHIMGYVQKSVNMITWKGAYDKEIDAGESHDDAVRKADAAVRMSQSAGGVKDLASIQRGGHVQQTFIMFYTYFSALYGRLSDTGREVKGGNPAAVARLTWLIILPTLLEGVLRDKGPEDDEEWMTWFSTQCLLYGLTSIPFARDIASGMMGKYGYNLTPVTKFGESITRAYNGIEGQINEGDDMTDAEFKAAFDALGIAFKLPTGQIWSTGEYVRNFDDVEDPIREFLVGVDRD